MVKATHILTASQKEYDRKGGKGGGTWNRWAKNNCHLHSLFVGKEKTKRKSLVTPTSRAEDPRELFEKNCKNVLFWKKKFWNKIILEAAEWETAFRPFGLCRLGLADSAPRAAAEMKIFAARCSKGQTRSEPGSVCSDPEPSTKLKSRQPEMKENKLFSEWQQLRSEQG